MPDAPDTFCTSEESELGFDLTLIFAPMTFALVLADPRSGTANPCEISATDNAATSTLLFKVPLSSPVVSIDFSINPIYYTQNEPFPFRTPVKLSGIEAKYCHRKLEYRFFSQRLSCVDRTQLSERRF